VRSVPVERAGIIPYAYTLSCKRTAPIISDMGFAAAEMSVPMRIVCVSSSRGDFSISLLLLLMAKQWKFIMLHTQIAGKEMVDESVSNEREDEMNESWVLTKISYQQLICGHLTHRSYAAQALTGKLVFFASCKFCLLISERAISAPYIDIIHIKKTRNYNKSGS
jgi:hypothetical protein